MSIKRKLKMGMVGGGPGAFIGNVHRKAIGLDGQIELVAGAFDIDPQKSKQMGEELMLDPSRVYDTFQQMIEFELKLPRGERIDCVAITTPNKSHYTIAIAFLKAGFHVMCEKPMTFDAEEAKALKKVVDETGMVFGLMHNYTGYPMVKLARDLVKQGELGKIRKIEVQYKQDWLATAIEKEGQMQASWRTDPKQSGGAGSIGDIGTHAAHLVEYISGLQINEICADLTAFVEDRMVDDDCNCFFKLDKGAKALMHICQVAVGEENHLAIWIYGEKKSLHWDQEHPNYLHVGVLGGAEQVWKRGTGYIAEMSEAAARGTRVPNGHPEGFLEAFANIYCNFADTIRAHIAGIAPSELINDFPKVDDGVRGMCLIETVLENSKSDKKWTPLLVA